MANAPRRGRGCLSRETRPGLRKRVACEERHCLFDEGSRRESIVSTRSRLEKRWYARSSSDPASLRSQPELDVGDISGNHSFDLAKRGTQTCLSQPDARFQARIDLSPCEQLPSRRVSRGAPSTAETLERGMRIGLARHQPGPLDKLQRRSPTPAASSAKESSARSQPTPGKIVSVRLSI